MATTFGILATILLVLASWVGFKNKQAKEAQAVHLKNELSEKDKLEKANALHRKIIKEENESYNNNLVQLADKMDERDKKEDQRDALIAEAAKIQKKINTLKASLEDFKDKVPDIGDVDKLIADLKETKKVIADLDESIATLKSDNEELTVKITNTNGTIDFNKGVMKNHEQYVSQSFLSTKVKAVYKNWGFVVLQDGDVKGVTPRSTLLVKRGEDIICELVVKNATNGAATAEIMFDTMLEGEFVQVGDTVVAKPAKKVVDPAAAKAVVPEEQDEDEKNEDEVSPFE